MLLKYAGIVTDTLYVDKNTSSYAYCYKISAVDRSLNESELSDAACNDYFYVAEMTFDIVSSDKTKIIKGWVHLIR